MCKDGERTDSASAPGPFKCTILLTCRVIVPSQVMSLSPAPLSLLIKAAPILTDDMYGDVQPAAWELLLSVDEHMAAAAGEFFAVFSLSGWSAAIRVSSVTPSDSVLRLCAPLKRVLMLCKTFWLFIFTICSLADLIFPYFIPSVLMY